jgi:hypothetical protein
MSIITIIIIIIIMITRIGTVDFGGIYDLKKPLLLLLLL